jgi:hypothetical protein
VVARGNEKGKMKKEKGRETAGFRVAPRQGEN